MADFDVIFAETTESSNPQISMNVVPSGLHIITGNESAANLVNASAAGANFTVTK